MPLLEGRCKNCGGAIKFESDRDRGFCSFCGTQFVKEDLIINQHYHNDFSGANVILNDLESVEKQLENAENNLTRLKDYSRAETIFKNITQKASGEYRAWWGLVRAISHDFTIKPSFQNYEIMYRYAKNAISVTDDANIQRQLKLQWYSFNNLIKTQNDEMMKNNNSIISKENEKIFQEDNKILGYQDDINQSKSLVNELENKLYKYESSHKFLDKIVLFSGLAVIFLFCFCCLGFVWAWICLMIFLSITVYSLVKPSFDAKSIKTIKEQIEVLKNKYENEEKLIDESRTTITEKRNNIERIKQSVSEIYNLKEL